MRSNLKPMCPLTAGGINDIDGIIGEVGSKEEMISNVVDFVKGE